MGDGISMQIQTGRDKSVVFFSHWMGKRLIAKFDEYVLELKDECGVGKSCLPIDRREPNTVLVDFIRYFTNDMDRIESDFYLGATEKDGDNSDNGHWLFCFDTKDWKHKRGKYEG